MICSSTIYRCSGGTKCALVEMYFDYKSSPTSITVQEREYTTKQYIFTRMLKQVITNILQNLRTIEVCTYNSISMSGEQFIMYQQLMIKLCEGKNHIGAYG